MTPREALIRGGHKHPDQIMEDLGREGYKPLNISSLIKMSKIILEDVKYWEDIESAKSSARDLVEYLERKK